MIQLDKSKILNGHVLDILREIPDDSVDMIMTSPPYFGLRAYGPDTMVIWDGDPDCKHEKSESDFCVKCNAWYGQLGLEPHVDLFVEHLMQVIRELWRILKPTGSFFLNIGDTYASSMGPHGDETAGFSKEAMVKNKPPRPESPKMGRMLIPSRVALRMQEEGWMFPDEQIWHKPNCCLGTCQVYGKSSGQVLRTTMDDFARLPIDTLYLPGINGWRKVLSIERQPINDAMVLHLRNGTQIGVTPEHRFPVTGDLVEARNLKLGMKLKHHTLPSESSGSQIGSYENGWTVGLFLAEGNYDGPHNTVRFSLNKSETGSWREYDYDRDNSKSVFADGKIPTAVIMHYVSGRGASKKHLSRECLNESNIFLRGVLDGFLAGDGNYDARNNRWRVNITRNLELEHDLKSLCARLGISLRTRPRQATNQTGKEYSSINMELRMERSSHPNNKDDYEIVRIERTTGISYEVSVDGDHLFLLHDGTVTHNSMPSSVKSRLANSWEPIFRAVKNHRTIRWRIMRDHADYKAGTWLDKRPSTPHREWLLLIGWGGFKAGTWIVKKPPKKTRGTIWERSRTNWLGFPYYFELDAIRVPHRTGPTKFNIRVRDGQSGKLDEKYGGQYSASEEETRLYDEHQMAAEAGDPKFVYDGKFTADPESVNSPRARTARAGYDAQSRFYHPKGANPSDTLELASSDPWEDILRDRAVTGGGAQREALQAYLVWKQLNPQGTYEQFFDVASSGKLSSYRNVKREQIDSNSKESAQSNYAAYLHLPNPKGQHPQDIILDSTAKYQQAEAEQAIVVGGVPNINRQGHSGYSTKDGQPLVDFEKGKNPGDIAEATKERIGDAHEGWATTNLYGPHVTHHKLGKNPSDTVETKFSKAEDHVIGGAWKDRAPRSTHEEGPAPRDVTEEHREKDDERHRLDHLSLPPEPEVDPARAFSQGGRNPGDTMEPAEGDVESIDFQDPDTLLELEILADSEPEDFQNITTQPFKEAHFAVFPLGICWNPILSACPPDGIVMDPFAGSGTLAEAVEILNRSGERPSPERVKEIREIGRIALLKYAAERRFVMIEKKPAYCDIMKRRLSNYADFDIEVVISSSSNGNGNKP